MKSITRRDPGGNVLNNGEYYSKSNGAYRFSYTDPLGKRRQISAVNLEKLREKEIREAGISLKESMADGKRQSIKSLLTEPMRDNDRMDVLQKGVEVYR